MHTYATEGTYTVTVTADITDEGVGLERVSNSYSFTVSRPPSGSSFPPSPPIISPPPPTSPPPTVPPASPPPTSVSGNIVAIPTDGSTPTHSGWVAENNDNDNYNFYGDPSTSLNQMFDRDEFARVAGEDDLVAIRIDPVSGASSGDMTQIHYTSPNIRVWRNADKSGWSILSDMPTFNALTTTTIYVEGLKLSGAVNAEKIDLMYASANASVPPFILSTVAFTVYKVTGAANVPGYSKHVYEATIPGPNGATYGPVVNGSIIQIGASVPAPGGGATVNTVSVKWAEGAVVGTLQVNAPGGKFSFTKQVNVVKVDFVDGADNKLVLDNRWHAQSVRRKGSILRILLRQTPQCMAAFAFRVSPGQLIRFGRGCSAASASSTSVQCKR